VDPARLTAKFKPPQNKEGVQEGTLATRATCLIEEIVCIKKTSFGGMAGRGKEPLTNEGPSKARRRRGTCGGKKVQFWDGQGGRLVGNILKKREPRATKPEKRE